MMILHALMTFLMVVSFGSGVIFFMALVASVSLEHAQIKQDIQFVSKVALALSVAVFLISFYIDRSLL